jgi:hypothetical protein
MISENLARTELLFPRRPDDAREVSRYPRVQAVTPRGYPMTAMLHLSVLLLALAGGMGTARACNESCTDGFVFDDNEGICVRVNAASA